MAVSYDRDQSLKISTIAGFDKILGILTPDNNRYCPGARPPGKVLFSHGEITGPDMNNGYSSFLTENKSDEKKYNPDV